MRVCEHSNLEGDGTDHLFPKLVRYQLRHTSVLSCFKFEFGNRGCCFGNPLAVPKICFDLERQQILTAALRYARCIVHRTRSQPHPKQAPYQLGDTPIEYIFVLVAQ